MKLESTFAESDWADFLSDFLPKVVAFIVKSVICLLVDCWVD